MVAVVMLGSIFSKHARHEALLCSLFFFLFFFWCLLFICSFLMNIANLFSVTTAFDVRIRPSPANLMVQFLIFIILFILNMEGNTFFILMAEFFAILNREFFIFCHFKRIFFLSAIISSSAITFMLFEIELWWWGWWIW